MKTPDYVPKEGWFIKLSANPAKHEIWCDGKPLPRVQKVTVSVSVGDSVPLAHIEVRPVGVELDSPNAVLMEVGPNGELLGVPEESQE